MNKISNILTVKKSKHVAAFIAVFFITSCTNNHVKPDNNNGASHPFMCHAANELVGKVVGSGHCVALIKSCSGAPHTDQWRPGKHVMSQTPESLKAGTIIATFLRDRYPNKTGWHAAVYIEHGPEGIWVWDQWKNKPVHKRLIRHRKGQARPANNANHYRVVKFIQ